MNHQPEAFPGERSSGVPVTARDPRSFTRAGCSTTGPSQAGRREHKEPDRPEPENTSKGNAPTGHCVGVHSAVRGRSRRCQRTSRSGDTARTGTRVTATLPDEVEPAKSREGRLRRAGDESQRVVDRRSDLCRGDGAVTSNSAGPPEGRPRRGRAKAMARTPVSRETTPRTSEAHTPEHGPPGDGEVGRTHNERGGSPGVHRRGRRR